MRVHLMGDVSAGQFSHLFIKVGDGEYPESEGKITIPAGLGSVVTTLEDLKAKIYPDIFSVREKSLEWLSERAILTPKNDSADTINDCLLKSFEEKTTRKKFKRLQFPLKNITGISNYHSVQFAETEMIFWLYYDMGPGEKTGIKTTPEKALKEMGEKRNKDGTKAFLTIEKMTTQQIRSMLSRMEKKGKLVNIDDNLEDDDPQEENIEQEEDRNEVRVILQEIIALDLEERF
ncbi:hypothetical protein JTE90_024176 [Oedothorax gibbosus]|uniref:ATP-dependent DNA helicase n=1 Tax=Oedothorax gibbosus TaxID=931172 RepID=A0AAV6UEI4_9ARAC|nr:hypothetical protein JTE90_024176 [Oedothorax gibbosus]